MRQRWQLIGAGVVVAMLAWSAAAGAAALTVTVVEPTTNNCTGRNFPPGFTCPPLTDLDLILLEIREADPTSPHVHYQQALNASSPQGGGVAVFEGVTVAASQTAIPLDICVAARNKKGLTSAPVCVRRDVSEIVPLIQREDITITITIGVAVQPHANPTP